MKDQLLEELSILHEKVASLKVYDAENAALLSRYAREFETLLTKLLTFNADKFKDISASYLDTLAQNGRNVLDVHDDTNNSGGFYNSVENLNNSINDSIETINSI